MTKWEKAVELFNQGYLCSSAVFGAYAEELGIDFETAVKVATPFGSGMRKAEVCGAATGALMVIGAKFGQKSVGESRVLVNGLTERFFEEFARENGSYMCCDLLKCDISTPKGIAFAKENNLFTTVCPKMVESAVKVLEKVLGEM